MIRVGRRIYNNSTGSYTDPHYDNFKTCLVLTASSQYGSLGPYVLKDDNGRIMENIWQASKIYKEVPDVVQKYSRYDNKIIWQWKKERHVDDNGVILPAYWNWRQHLMDNNYAVRYPLGFGKNKLCLYAIMDKDDGSYEYNIDYINARKKIYGPVYCDLAKKQKQFKDLQKELNDGNNLLITEVDGPHGESIDYYKNKYGVNDNFIENNTMLVNEENIKIMLNDDKYPFGHGYCLACALLNKDKEWLS